MKILFISNGFPPLRWAGTETYTAGIAHELQERGHSVQVICAGDWDAGKNYWNDPSTDLDQGVQVNRLNLNWEKAPDPFGYLYNNPVVADYLSDYLQKNRPDVVHITSCETLSASVINTAKAAGLPIVLSLTDFWFLCPRINLLRSDGTNCDGKTTAWDCLRCLALDSKVYRWPRKILSEWTVSTLLTQASKHPIITRQRGLKGVIGDISSRKSFLHTAIGLADYRITASPFVRDLFVQNGVSLPIRVQPYGHNLAWMAGYAGKTSSDVLRIGFIGQIVPSKGIHLLLNAVKDLTAQHKDKFKLLIYGNMAANPAYSDELQAMSAGLENVHFCGIYPHDQSASVFENLDILVVPSLWYDFPLIIYEAFATQTPVIATRLGGMAEAVKHEENGLLFQRNDVEDLTAQLRRIIEEPNLYSRLKAGIQAVKTVEEEVNELEEIYFDLLKQSQGATP